MGASKIEQLIEDIYTFIENCKTQPLSSTKVIVPKDELYDLLDELRLRTPDEIKRYQKIIANRDAILTDAEEKASVMLAEAEEKTNALIEEHEIMQQAYYQANEVVAQAVEEANKIIEQANDDAQQIQSGVLVYADEMLSEIENILTNAYESTKSKSDSLLSSLKGNLDIVRNNKNELSNQAPEVAVSDSSAYGSQGGSYQPDFEFDENTFLEDVDQ